MSDLELTRREYADQIRDVLWRQCHVRLSDELRFAFAQIPRENFLGPAPWLIRGIAAGRVVAVEVDGGLAARARANLRSVQGVDVIEADGGVHDPGPMDAILVNAGVTHPRAVWFQCLGLGGRMVLPVTDDDGKGMMLKVTRDSHQPSTDCWLHADDCCLSTRTIASPSCR